MRRGHRLKRLAYDLQGLAAAAQADGMDSVANGLHEAAGQAAYAGDVYFKVAGESSTTITQIGDTAYPVGPRGL